MESFDLDCAALIAFVKPSWRPFFQQEIKQPYFKQLWSALTREYHEHVCYPAKSEIFYLFTQVELTDLKVVIIGQDPYHNVGQANGLAFSVHNDTKTPPSLKNIFQELATDLQIDHSANNDLSLWVRQGVFLMNTSWTVRAHQPASHTKIGWNIFTTHLLQCINSTMGLVYLLWGNHAKGFKNILNNPQNVILESGHPSPFSYHLFKGSKPFSKVNDILLTKGQSPIDWNR